jgi:hypothetical protein
MNGGKYKPLTKAHSERIVRGGFKEAERRGVVNLTLTSVAVGN